jgi:hypothetical protein
MSATLEGRRAKVTPQFIQAGQQAAAAWREDVAAGVKERPKREGVYLRINERRMRLFAQAVAKGETLTGAAVAAGATKGAAGATGSRWIKRDDVQAMIEEERERLEAERQDTLTRVVVPTREDVLRDILEVRDEAKRTKNQTLRLKCNELVGKEIGMFVNRSEVAVSSALDAMPASVLLEWRRAVEAASIGASVIDVTDDEEAQDVVPEGLDEAEHDPLA